MKHLGLVLVFVSCLSFAKSEFDWDKVLSGPLYRFNYDYSKENRNPNLKITGGEEAVPHSFPWQAALYIPLEGGTYFCGGSLISLQTVMTSARCLTDPIIGEIGVVLGAHNIREAEATQYRVSTGEYLVFPNYDNVTHHNDLALVYLAEPVELNDYIQTINLPTDSNLYYEQMVNVSGWGKTADSDLTISSTLQTLELRVITNVICNILYLGQISDSQICCNGESGRSTCDGDSGSALVYQGIQIGIVSYSVNHGCEAGYPPVFTRVSSYSVWIAFNRR